MSQLRAFLGDDARLRFPFAGAAVVPLVSVGSPSRSNSAWWWAIALTLALTLATFLVPWRRLSDCWQASVPLAFLVLVGLLRHVGEGAASGFSPLMRSTEVVDGDNGGSYGATEPGSATASAGRSSSAVRSAR